LPKVKKKKNSLEKLLKELLQKKMIEDEYDVEEPV